MCYVEPKNSQIPLSNFRSLLKCSEELPVVDRYKTYDAQEIEQADVYVAKVGVVYQIFVVYGVTVGAYVYEVDETHPP